MGAKGTKEYDKWVPKDGGIGALGLGFRSDSLLGRSFPFP